MKDQLFEAIESYESWDGKEVTEIVTSPAQRHLRLINNECPKLSGKQRELFHTVVAKLLYIMKRTRPDLETSIDHLCTRVTKSDEDDWKKLRRIIAWIKCTIEDKRIIGATSLCEIFTWIDAAYAVHDDMRSQTGGVISMGHGVLHCKSGKQKLNVKRSTEAELVASSYYIPYNL